MCVLKLLTDGEGGFKKVLYRVHGYYQLCRCRMYLFESCINVTTFNYVIKCYLIRMQPWDCFVLIVESFVFFLKEYYHVLRFYFSGKVKIHVI